MEIAFRTRRLQRAFEESDQAVRLWGTTVARKFIGRVLILQSAQGFSEIRRLASLRAHRLRGDRLGEWAIDLTGRYRLIVAVTEDEQKVIIEEVSSHYGD